MSETPTTYRVAVMGGTGPQGKGLGYRFARAGHDVVLGSRAAEKAVPVAAEVTAALGSGEIGLSLEQGMLLRLALLAALTAAAR